MRAPLLLVCLTALLVPSYQYDPCVYVSGVTSYALTANTNETYWTVPRNVHTLCVMLWGAGGGGGSWQHCTDSANNCGGGGGGSGAFGALTMDVSPGDNCTITVGTAGDGGLDADGSSPSAGGDGGSTSITCGNSELFEVGGGYGGGFGPSGGAGGAAGVAPRSGFNVAIPGNPGGDGASGAKGGLRGSQVQIPYNLPDMLQMSAGSGGNGAGYGNGNGGTSGTFLVLYQTDATVTVGTSSTSSTSSTTTTGTDQGTEKIEISPTIAALFGTVGLAFFIIIILLLGMLICVVRARRNPEGYTPVSTNVSTNISTNESHEGGSVF